MLQLQLITILELLSSVFLYLVLSHECMKIICNMIYFVTQEFSDMILKEKT